MLYTPLFFSSQDDLKSLRQLEFGKSNTFFIHFFYLNYLQNVNCFNICFCYYTVKFIQQEHENIVKNTIIILTLIVYLHTFRIPDVFVRALTNNENVQETSSELLIFVSTHVTQFELSLMRLNIFVRFLVKREMYWYSYDICVFISCSCTRFRPEEELRLSSNKKLMIENGFYFRGFLF